MYYVTGFFSHAWLYYVTGLATSGHTVLKIVKMNGLALLLDACHLSRRVHADINSFSSVRLLISTHLKKVGCAFNSEWAFIRDNTVYIYIAQCLGGCRMASVFLSITG